jgi:hypothetical protein
MFDKKLEREVSTATAWGVPDNESIGYSPAAWRNLVRKLEWRVLILEKLLVENGIDPTPEHYRDI